MRLLILILCFSLLTTYSRGQELSFYKENITIKIQNENLYVSGLYYLKSDTGKTHTLFYPFPVDSLYGEVDSLYIFNLDTEDIIEPLKVEKTHALFHVDFDNNNKIIIQISYRQQLLGSRAEYILKTTMSWGKPLEEAFYQFIIPDKLQVTNFSIPPQDSIETSHEKIYYWKKYNYMPSKNMVFEYRLK